jgi:hypothetical protein
MNKFTSAVVALALSFAVSGAAFAGSFNLGMITSPDSQVIGNSTATDPEQIPVAAGSFADEYLFSVDVASNYGSSATSISIAGGAAFSSLDSELFTSNDGNVWTSVIANTGVQDGNGAWTTSLTFSALDPDPTQYKLVVSGLKASGFAAYGGNLTVTPIPEPEIYAKMAAGLGLMGFVARRRQRNGAVA